MKVANTGEVVHPGVHGETLTTCPGEFGGDYLSRFFFSLLHNKHLGLLLTVRIGLAKKKGKFLKRNKEGVGEILKGRNHYIHKLHKYFL